MYFWGCGIVQAPLHWSQKLAITLYSGKDQADEMFDRRCKYGKQWDFKTVLNSTTETWYIDKFHS